MGLGVLWARTNVGVRLEDALMTRFGNLPAWVWQGTLSILVLGVSYLAGLLLKWVVSHRLMALAARTRGQLADVVVNELARRVPLWSVLLGIYLAAGFWTLPANVDTALTKALFVLIAVSLTFLSAAVVTKRTVLYGARFQQALPITKPHAEHRQGHRDHDGDSDCVERTRAVDHADADGTRRRRTGCRAGCREGEGCLWTENGRYGNPRDGPNPERFSVGGAAQERGECEVVAGSPRR
jgi:hypothetical protein